MLYGEEERVARSYSFGNFVLHPHRGLLLEGSTSLRIGVRALAVLITLVERPGEIITKRELLERV